ncbi:MAG: hypothetical protein GY898_06520 [Proteobacteria bacterium]|nr:hypothetical protein [Pseudomonadota bacterium]
MHSMSKWWLLVVLGLALLGCPDDDDDATSGVDDDDASDDDDGTDDDDASDDDDTVPPDPIECAGDDPVTAETEVNDTPENATVVTDLGDEGFCLEGSMECGDQGYLDLDLYSFTLPADREIQVVLRWTADADMDRYLWDAASYEPDSKEWLIPFEDGFVSPEDGEADVLDGQELLIEVGCWAGQNGDYIVEVSYVDTTLGDDDDSAPGDDDDSAVGDDDDDSAVGDDDDDSAVGDDDDDSAIGDDDDSAIGDDDDIAPDDDDSAPGDDDDSAVGDDGSVALI